MKRWIFLYVLVLLAAVGLYALGDAIEPKQSCPAAQTGSPV